MTRAITADAEDRLTKLATGESATFDLPADQPARQAAYQAVQNVAHHQFGPRNYSIRTEDDGRITVTRTLQKPFPAGRRQLTASLRKAAQ